MPRLIAPDRRASRRCGTRRSALSAASQMTTTADREPRDHDDDPGPEQRAQQDGGGDPPAGHAEHAREAAAGQGGKHAAVADLTTHLDGAHRVAADARGQHLREEQALEIRGAEAAPAEQRAGAGAGGRIGGAEQDTPFDDACGDREHGQPERGGDPERIGVSEAGDGLGQVDRAREDDQARRPFR